MDIRILKTSDAECYRKLRLEALQNNPESFGSSYEEEKAYSVDMYKNRLDSNYTFGAFKNKELIGIVTLFQEGRHKLKHKASIFALYVSPEKRGLQIGKHLMDEAIKKAKGLDGIEQIQLSVVASNAPAKKVYASLGFHTFGREKKALKIDQTYFDEEHMVLFL
ncbi:N-acetyltransferase family protein [Bacillus sp. 1P06AnD]|uniref:GNAT family N-acetyltransferase n=1 Tax=Bacillus sp. 1P06AnD TaxID=3132208 RepID=UPI0039A27D2E